MRIFLQIAFHTVDMHRNYLFIIAISFGLAMITLFSSTHVFNEPKKSSVVTTTQRHQTLPKNKPPKPRLPKEYKRFFSQFAP
jgi:hypothetical protein